MLPRVVWQVLAADLFCAGGTGLTLPFLVVYLHQVRGLGLGQAGAAVACLAGAGFLGNPAGGWLADRAGPGRAVITGWVLAGAGTVLLATAGPVAWLFPAAALTGLGVAVAWPALDALLARRTTTEQRSAAFAVRHLTMNLGLGAGALLAALLADIAVPGSFTTLYLLDAASFALSALLLIGTGTTAAAGRPSPGGPPDAPPAGYRALLRDRTFLRVWVLTVVLVTVGYGAFQVALPAVATGPGGSSASWLAVAFAANTVTVVAAQLPVLRVLAGHRRTRAIGWATAAWATCWALAWLGGTGGGALWFVGAATVFALGETLLAPTLSAIVNDIAPPPLQGRYNGALILAYTTGFTAAPLLCGLTLGPAPDGSVLFPVLVLGCGLCAVLAHRLRPRLPEAADLIANGT